MTNFHPLLTCQWHFYDVLEHPFGHPKLPPDPGRRPGHRRPDCPCTVPGGDPFLPMNGDTIGSITFSRSHRLRGGGGRGSQWAKNFQKSSIEGSHIAHHLGI